jgi:hypothetical protein
MGRVIKEAHWIWIQCHTTTFGSNTHKEEGMPLADKEVHLFHWPSAPEYQQSLLRVIALPVGAKGQLYYRKKWVNSTFVEEIGNINKGGGITALFWVLNCAQSKKDGGVVTTFAFACPLRLVNILNVEDKNDYNYINLVAKKFLSSFTKISTLQELEEYTKLEFGSPAIPYPGAENGYVYVGPKMNNLVTTDTPSLEALYAALKDISCPIKCQNGITIKDYPLVMIKTVEKSKVNDDGLYELSVNQQYEVTLSYYQGENYRNRNVYINENEFVGKSVSGAVPVEAPSKSKDRIDIKVESGNLKFVIPLNIAVKVPCYRRRWFPVFLLAIISVVLVALFTRLFPESGTQIIVALIFPLIVIFVDKILEALTKKD